MGKILELQSFFINGASGAGIYAPMAGVGTDSLQVKAAKSDSKIRCIAMWSQNETTLGKHEILSPMLHDSTRGYRYNVNINDPVNVIPKGCSIPLTAGDTLTVAETASVAGEGNLLHMLNLYDDLGSSEANLIKFDELKTRQVALTTIDNTITPAAEQVYSAPQLINAGSDLLHPGTEYALLGASVAVTNGALCITAPDFGNFRIGLPANVLGKLNNSSFFVDLAQNLDEACIPVINSDNKGNIIITIIQAMAALTATPFHLYLAQLSKK